MRNDPPEQQQAAERSTRRERASSRLAVQPSPTAAAQASENSSADSPENTAPQKNTAPQENEPQTQEDRADSASSNGASEAPRVIPRNNVLEVDQVIQVRLETSRSGQTLFAPSKITVHPLQIARVTLQNRTQGESAYACRWALVEPGRVNEVRSLGLDAGMDSGESVAYTPDFFAVSGLAQPGEQAQVTFETPETPGQYPFICFNSDPDQPRISGTLVVKPIS